LAQLTNLISTRLLEVRNLINVAMVKCEAIDPDKVINHEEAIDREEAIDHEEEKQEERRVIRKYCSSSKSQRSITIQETF
jgi:hypothetical protein